MFITGIPTAEEGTPAPLETVVVSEMGEGEEEYPDLITAEIITEGGDTPAPSTGPAPTTLGWEEDTVAEVVADEEVPIEDVTLAEDATLTEDAPPPSEAETDPNIPLSEPDDVAG